MTLDQEQMTRIMREVTLDMPHQLKTKEANEFRRRIEIQVADIVKQGYVPDWPLDFPDDDPEQD